MSRELTVRHTDGKNVYFILRQKNQAVIVSTHLLGDYLDAAWTTYAITGTEVTSAQSTVIYTGDVPSGLAKGSYTVEAYERIGATAAITDYYLGSATIEWSGTAEMTLATFTEVIPESASAVITAAVPTVEQIQDGLATEAKQDAAQEALDEVAANVAETLASVGVSGSSLAAIKQKTDLIVSGAVSIRSAITSSGELTLYHGDGGTAVIVSDSQSNWPSLTDATVKLQIASRRDLVTLLIDLAGTIVDAKTVTFFPTAAQTELLTSFRARDYQYRVIATWEHADPRHLAGPGSCTAIW